MLFDKLCGHFYLPQNSSGEFIKISPQTLRMGIRNPLRGFPFSFSHQARDLGELIFTGDTRAKKLN
jgi:hypothetical protein